MRKFNALYRIYKDDYDLELLLTLSRTTYGKLAEKQRKADEWL